MYRQFTSDAESSNNCSDSSEEMTESGWDSEAERAELMRFQTKLNKALDNIGKQSQHKLTDWEKIRIACLNWTPAATIHAFLVRVTRAQGSNITAIIRHFVNKEYLAPIPAAVHTAITSVMAGIECDQGGHVTINSPQSGRSLAAAPPCQEKPR